MNKLQYDLEDRLKKIVFWGRYGGILSIVIGLPLALFGSIFYLIGALPGIFLSLIGGYMFKISKSADRYLKISGSSELEALKIYSFIHKMLRAYSLISLTIVLGAVLIVFLMSIVGFFGYFRTPL